MGSLYCLIFVSKCFVAFVNSVIDAVVFSKVIGAFGGKPYV